MRTRKPGNQGRPKRATQPSGRAGKRTTAPSRATGKTSWYLALAASRPSRRRFLRIAFFVLLAYAFLLTAPFGFEVTNVGLDASWRYATNFLPHSQFRYGPDVIFTCGPLGFVNFPEYFENNLAIVFSIRLLVWVFLFSRLAARIGRSGEVPWGCFAAVAAAIVGHYHLLTFDYLLETAGLLALIRTRPEDQPFWTSTLPLGLLTALAFLGRQTACIVLLLSIGAWYTAWYIRERRTPSLASWLRLGCMAIAPLVAYLLYNASLSGLWAYVTGSIQEMSGYSVAMSLPGFPEKLDYIRLPALVALWIGFGVCAVWRRWLRVEIFGCLLAAFYLGLRHGMVRSDAHVLYTYGFAIVLMGLLLLECRPARSAVVAGSAALASVCVIALSGLNANWRVTTTHYWSPGPQLDQINEILHWGRTMASAAAQKDHNLLADRLPESLLRAIGQSPVVAFPWELSYGPANRLHLFPLYTLQAYSAYTHELDMRTAHRLLDQTPPDTRLLVQWEDLDERHPLLDVPQTWTAISDGFAPEAMDSDILLLKKRDRARTWQSSPISSASADARQWQPVPERNYAVKASIWLPLTAYGTARKLLYRIEPVYMEFRTGNGLRRKFRVIPDVLQQEFVVNCLPLTGEAMKAILFEDTCRNRVTAFRFSGPGLTAFSANARITFSGLPGRALQFASDERGQADASSHSGFR